MDEKIETTGNTVLAAFERRRTDADTGYEASPMEAASAVTSFVLNQILVMILSNKPAFEKWSLEEFQKLIEYVFTKIQQKINP